MARSKLRLRPWQKMALDRYQAEPKSDFLAVATPGAGKTTFALTTARLTLPQLSGRLVIVAPTKHLKEQWADAAENFGLILDADYSPSDGLPSDMHGVVTTYQQIGTNPEPFRSLSAGGFVILDEIHHAGDERSWGDGVRTAFEGATRRLALSGTPFRSDTRTIPFVDYRNDEVVADVEYGYGEAIADGKVVRPVYFPAFGGDFEWSAPDGAVLAASFDDPLARTQANQRLRTALSLEGDWLPTVLAHANQRLMQIRAGRHPEAGGLVIAMDQAHAWGIAELLRNTFRVNATVAVSDDPEASNKISRFAGGDAPWIVAVRMVSEGVDIPRLRVGVFATTTTTELFFRQAVGRIVRYTAGKGRQRAYLFIPDDPRLRLWSSTMSEVRKHRLERRSEAETDEYPQAEEDPTAFDKADGEEQLSLFQVLSATASDPPPDPDLWGDDDDDDDDEITPTGEGDDDELTLDLAALPAVGPGGLTRRPNRKERDRLRDLNATLARDIATVTGRTHAAVNFELNRMSGVNKVAEATIDLLERRARLAEEWLQREQRRSRYARFV